MSSRWDDDLGLLWFITAATRGYHLVTWHHAVEGVQRHWVHVGDLRRYVELIDWLGRGMVPPLEIEVSAVPRPSQSHGTAGLSSVFWVRTEGGKQLERLERFRPRPTIVLEEGDSTRRVALWALSVPMNYEWVVRGNKRLAHALRAPKKHAEPEFMFNPPGSCLRDGRARPVLIRTAEVDESRVYKPGEVVGRLKDAPDADAWKKPAPAKGQGRLA
ncbi:hypothetical protein DSM104299_03198 [Baekduia alba]|nr:hypothetical protein DSM104299_03198 [Baekduia alba]